MAVKAKQRQKEFILDADKVRRLKRILKAKSETAAIEEVIQMAIDNDRFYRSHVRLLENGGKFVDTFERVPQ